MPKSYRRSRSVPYSFSRAGWIIASWTFRFQKEGPSPTCAMAVKNKARNDNLEDCCRQISLINSYFQRAETKSICCWVPHLDYSWELLHGCVLEIFIRILELVLCIPTSRFQIIKVLYSLHYYVSPVNDCPSSSFLNIIEYVLIITLGLLLRGVQIVIFWVSRLRYSKQGKF